MQTENWLGQTGERGAYKPQSEILNRQGAKNAKTEMADWGEGRELLNAP